MHVARFRRRQSDHRFLMLHGLAMLKKRAIVEQPVTRRLLASTFRVVCCKRMIELVRYRDFKALCHVDLSLGPFTVIVGPNASGKTSLLQGIQCISDGVCWDEVGPHPWSDKARALCHQKAKLPKFSLECQGIESSPVWTAVRKFEYVEDEESSSNLQWIEEGTWNGVSCSFDEETRNYYSSRHGGPLAGPELIQLQQALSSSGLLRLDASVSDRVKP